MRVIIIYGPPGVGKMSVTKELVKITNGKYFPHNLIFELIMPIIGGEKDDNVLWELYEDIKIHIMASAKRKRKDIILTEIYDNPLSDSRFKKFIRELDKLKIKYSFVKLMCNKSEHLKRVSNENRKNTQKISSIKLLNKIMKKGNLDAEIPFVKSLVIDTTKLSAKKTAQMIKKRLKLF